MSFPDRSTAASLGLALGDAFGPLEFISGPAVRNRPVPIGPGRFDWTDDIHMALRGKRDATLLEWEKRPPSNGFAVLR